MLLQQGASVDDEIVIADPHAAVDKPVETKPAAPEKKVKPILKWRPLQQQQQQKKEPTEKRAAFSIFQVGFYMEWKYVLGLALRESKAVLKEQNALSCLCWCYACCHCQFAWLQR